MHIHTHHWADIQSVTSSQIYRIGNSQRALPKFLRGGNHANSKVKKKQSLHLLYCYYSVNRGIVRSPITHGKLSCAPNSEAKPRPMSTTSMSLRAFRDQTAFFTEDMNTQNTRTEARSPPTTPRSGETQGRVPW